MRWTLAGALLLLAACASGPRAEVGIYVRNVPNADLYMEVESGGEKAGGGLGGGPAGPGGGNWCMSGISVPWTLKIGPSVDQLAVLVTSEQVSDPRSAEIWIDIRAGGILWGEGMPEWSTAMGPICERRPAPPPPP